MSFEEMLADTVRRVLREELPSALAQAPRAGGEDRRVTAAEAAAAAGVGVSTIREWADKGLIQRYGEGRGVRYSLAEVLAVRPAARTLKASLEERAEEILRRTHG